MFDQHSKSSVSFSTCANCVSFFFFCHGTCPFRTQISSKTSKEHVDVGWCAIISCVAAHCCILCWTRRLQVVMNSRSTVSGWRYLQCSKTKEGEGPSRACWPPHHRVRVVVLEGGGVFFYQQRVKTKSRWNKFGDPAGTRCFLAGQQGCLLHSFLERQSLNGSGPCGTVCHFCVMRVNFGPDASPPTAR